VGVWSGSRALLWGVLPSMACCLLTRLGLKLLGLADSPRKTRRDRRRYTAHKTPHNKHTQAHALTLRKALLRTLTRASLCLYGLGWSTSSTCCVSGTGTPPAPPPPPPSPPPPPTPTTALAWATPPSSLWMVTTAPSLPSPCPPPPSPTPLPPPPPLTVPMVVGSCRVVITTSTCPCSPPPSPLAKPPLPTASRPP
jgi:hypothetical protein